MMTYFEAASIKQDFAGALQFADALGKTKEEAYKETAEKYTNEQLAEALMALNENLDEQKETNHAIFVLAVRSKGIKP
jgi:aminopeptidase N